MLDGRSFDPLTLFDDGFGPPEVGDGRFDVFQALMAALVVIVFDERFDLGLEIAKQEVVLQKDAVLQGLVPALDLILGLRMERCAANMAHALGFDLFRQLASDVAGAVVANESGFVHHGCPVPA